MRNREAIGVLNRESAVEGRCERADPNRSRTIFPNAGGWELTLQGAGELTLQGAGDWPSLLDDGLEARAKDGWCRYPGFVKKQQCPRGIGVSRAAYDGGRKDGNPLRPGRQGTDDVDARDRQQFAELLKSDLHLAARDERTDRPFTHLQSIADRISD